MPGQRFAFGPFVLNPEAGTLLLQGAPVPVGYRGFLLLKAFLERPGEVLTKTDLFDAAWQGAVVEETNLTVQIASLRKLLGQSPGGGEWIATIPRVGYRFVASVDRPMDRTPGQKAPFPEREPGTGPSIAVLPFVNISADPEQEYFADGIVEDIITGLSQLRWLFVIARNSTYAYKGKAPDVRQVANDLGAQYVLEGSVRRVDDHIRVASQLVDATAGVHVWAERYDRAVTDIFAVQDEITQSVVASIEPQLYAAEYRRIQSKPPESLDAWGYVMRAMPDIWTWGDRESERAIANLRCSIAIEPDYPRAHSLLAWSYITGAHMGRVPFSDVRGLALDSARRAITRDGEDPWGHLALGYVHTLSRQFNDATSELNEALWLNPNFALGYMVLGAAYGFDGRGDEGLKHLAVGSRLSPRDPHQSLYQSACALCHFVEGRYQESIALNRRAVQLRPHFVSAWRTLAAAAGLAGDQDTAMKAVSESLKLQPELSTEWIERSYALVQREHRELYIQGLRNAGLK
jgi:TolB-like protein/tetratricopeptide (TPR) repeat protein